MLSTKIIVYGEKDSGAWLTATKLMHDNPFFDTPTEINNPKEMKSFLASTNSLAICYTTCINKLMSRCKGEKFGPVLFIAAPDEIEKHANHLIETIVYNGNPPNKLWAQ